MIKAVIRDGSELCCGTWALTKYLPRSKGPGHSNVLGIKANQALRLLSFGFACDQWQGINLRYCWCASICLSHSSSCSVELMKVSKNAGSLLLLFSPTSLLPLWYSDFCEILNTRCKAEIICKHLAILNTLIFKLVLLMHAEAWIIAAFGVLLLISTRP